MAALTVIATSDTWVLGPSIHEVMLVLRRVAGCQAPWSWFCSLWGSGGGGGRQGLHLLASHAGTSVASAVNLSVPSFTHLSAESCCPAALAPEKRLTTLGCPSGLCPGAVLGSSPGGSQGCAAGGQRLGSPSQPGASLWRPTVEAGTPVTYSWP